MALISLLVVVWLLIVVIIRFGKAISFLNKNKRAFRFYVLDNVILEQHTKEGFAKMYKRSEPSLLKLVFSRKPLALEQWYTAMEYDLYFTRYKGFTA